jgi:hypothetical protein
MIGATFPAKRAASALSLATRLPFSWQSLTWPLLATVRFFDSEKQKTAPRLDSKNWKNGKRKAGCVSLHPWAK